MKRRLDKYLSENKIVQTRSQAENYIKLGVVTVNGSKVLKPGYLVGENDKVILAGEQYVSRAALKLASISDQFGLNFRGKTVLDVGSSTGGFTDFALQNGAKKVIAVDVGTKQMHPKLANDPKVDLHEKTDIRKFQTDQKIDVIVADVSFVSLTKIMPSLKKFSSRDTQLIMMCKPQFEAGKGQTNKGIIKNSAIRRQILKDFEVWLTKNGFIVRDKADSQVAGTKGNLERFYSLSRA